MDNKKTNQPKPSNGELLQEIHSKVDAIYTFIFGGPDMPVSLIMQVDRNTRFRNTVTKILFLLVPVVASLVYYVLTHPQGGK